MVTSDVMKITLKYFFYPGLRPGWILLQVLDPYIGPRAAKSILKELRKLRLIDNLREVRNDHNVVPQTTLLIDNIEENEVSNSTDEDEDADIDSDKEYVDNAQEENIVEWTIDSETHAAPTVTMAEYENIVVDRFMNTPLKTVRGLVDAYGLGHKTVIEELTKISEGNLMKHLNDNIEEWQAHDHVSPQYWEMFHDKFPALADTLTINFQARSITGTPVDQTFCLSATQIRANQSADTNAKNMNHASSVKGAITRERET
jgi:hypothetical protein